MRADICEADDVEGLARFHAALQTLGAVRIGHAWAIGVDHWQYRIGVDTLDVFSDAWSVDVDGSAALVEEVVRLSKSPAA